MQTHVVQILHTNKRALNYQPLTSAFQGLSEAEDSCEGIDASVASIHEILDAEAALGLPYSRIMLAGFSQGGTSPLTTYHFCFYSFQQRTLCTA
jgi:predicted esterase